MKTCTELLHSATSMHIEATLPMCYNGSVENHTRLAEQLLGEPFSMHRMRLNFMRIYNWSKSTCL